jgi:hypothetical protein
MNNVQIITLIYSSVSIALFGIFLLGLYRDYCIDRFRQEMFAIRDGLFDFAAANGIAFDHPAYGMLRSTMNGFIRFADRLTLLHSLILRLLTKRDENHLTRLSFESRWQRHAESLSAEQLKRLQTARREMNVLVARHLIRSSPFLIVTVIVPLVIWAILKFAVDRFIHFLKSPLDDLDATAFEIGQAKMA